MKSGEFSSENSLRRNLANAKGKFSNLFMNSGELGKENPSKKKSLEESVRMEGYDVNVSNQAKSHTDMKQQPMTGYSEFWLG